MMQHPIHRVSSFRIVDDYQLAVTFDDETEQVIDFRPVLAGQMLGPLRELTLSPLLINSPQLAGAAGVVG